MKTPLWLCTSPSLPPSFSPSQVSNYGEIWKPTLTLTSDCSSASEMSLSGGISERSQAATTAACALPRRGEESRDWLAGWLWRRMSDRDPLSLLSANGGRLAGYKAGTVAKVTWLQEGKRQRDQKAPCRESVALKMILIEGKKKKHTEQRKYALCWRKKKQDLRVCKPCFEGCT